MSAVPSDADDPEFRDERAEGAENECVEVNAEPAEVDRDDVRNLPDGLWARLRADPKSAPLYLALAARCPSCGKRDAVRIVYGYPSPELFEMAKRGEVALGSGALSPVNRHCRSCGENFIGGVLRAAISLGDRLPMRRRSRPKRPANRDHRNN